MIWISKLDELEYIANLRVYLALVFLIYSEIRKIDILGIPLKKFTAIYSVKSTLF